MLMAIMEVVLPGNAFISIKKTEQLEKLTNMPIPAADRADIQSVIDTYPVRLSMHTIRQMRVSGDVAYQYLPFVEELDNTGHTNTWIGQFHQGLLEQMYQNRVIFLLNMSCPVYCRFCFRKHKDSRNETNPTPADVEKAVAHVAASPSIKEIVITGGDPFMNRANMARAIDGLMADRPCSDPAPGHAFHRLLPPFVSVRRCRPAGLSEAQEPRASAARQAYGSGHPFHSSR